jgi:hypothetical protein
MPYHQAMDRPAPVSPSASVGDTSEEARSVQVECYRRMAPWQKLSVAMELGELADAFALAGIADRHPDADDEERRMRLLSLKYGPELVARAYGWSAET